MNAHAILLEDDLLTFKLVILYSLEEFILKHANIKVSVYPPLHPAGKAYSLVSHTAPNHNRTPAMLCLTFYIPVSKAITRPLPYPLPSMRPKTFNNYLIRPNDAFSISFRPLLMHVYPVSTRLLMPWKEPRFLLLASSFKASLSQGTGYGVINSESVFLTSFGLLDGRMVNCSYSINCMTVY